MAPMLRVEPKECWNAYAGHLGQDSEWGPGWEPYLRAGSRSWFELVRGAGSSWLELVRAGSHDTYPLMGTPEVNFEFIFGSAVKNYS